MQTQTQTRTSTLNANLSELPILKHFNQNEISTKVDTFRKGEKNLFWFLKLAVLVGIGFLTWTYVLPPVFQAIGQMLAVAATAVMVVAGIIMAPVIVKGIRLFTRAIHKALIKYDHRNGMVIISEKDGVIKEHESLRKCGAYLGRDVAAVHRVLKGEWNLCNGHKLSYKTLANNLEV